MKHFRSIILLLLLFYGCAKSTEEANMQDVRKPAVAGSWYPGNADSLRSMIGAFMQSANVEKIDGRIVGLIAPHAGYIYSGPVAAYAFKSLMLDKEKYKGNTVLLIGFSHRPTGWQGISVWAKGFWETPLGKIPIDETFAQKIISHNPNKIQFRKEVFVDEHSLEMELPFIQYALDNNFKLVPISFSHQTMAEIETISSAILAAEINWDRTILVVSTDMSHYHPYDEAMQLDQKTLEFVLSGDIAGLVKWMNSGVDAFCGWGGVITAMTVLPMIGAQKTILLKYANSGDAQPSTASRGVVGYSAVAYVMTGDVKSDISSNTPGDPEYSLTEEQQKYLLKLARKTIEELVEKDKKYEPPKPDDPKLIQDAPVFVTIHNRGRLRGCIGQMVARGPLYLAVRDMAIAAASQDYRFQPVSKDELNEIDIEISVLSPLRKIDSWEKIEPFKHGVYVKRGMRTGVFLPQVWGQIPDREEFLSELCSQKAGLERDCYKKPDTELYIYTVFEFNELDLKLK